MENIVPIFATIAMQSSTHPHKKAIVFGENTLSFLELETLSNQVAHYLLECYPNNPKGNVAIYLEPCLLLPAIILGVMKAGFSYVPLSSFQPPKRLTQILDDAGSLAIITTTALQRKLSGTKKNIINIESNPFQHFPTDGATLPKVTKEDLAYILYTSGSTGIPKGVEINHANLSYYINWFNNELWTKTQALLPLTSSLSFAAAVSQLFSPLSRGDTLHILPSGILNHPERLLSWLNQQDNTALYCVPTIWHELLDYAQSHNIESQLPKTVFLSGEAVADDLKQRTFHTIDNVRLFNLYGPTETVANCTYSELSAKEEVHLGQAIKGSQAFLLDKNNQPVAKGDIGEICIAGPGVAMGYRQRPNLTQQRFFQYAGQTAHRTGDLGRFNEQGQLIYLGRKDRQVKINGVRIELSEIEAYLRQFSIIADAAVKYIDGALIGYLKTSEKPSAWDLRSFLKQRCPDAMIPSQFIYLESFPKLPNGKLDLSRLPAPRCERPNLSGEYCSPSNELEKDIIDIWQEVLGFSSLGVNDDFFELGGSSLQAMRARTLIRRRMYSEIDLNLFFNNPTPRRLASVIPYYLTNGADEIDPAQQTLMPSDDGYQPLSSQESYFVTLEQTSDNKLAYQPAFAIHIQGKIDLDALNWSLQRVLTNNPILRTRFNLDDHCALEGGFRTDDILIKRIDVSHLETNLKRLSDQTLIECADLSEIDIDTTAPISLSVMSRNQTEHAVLIRVHHAVFDHESIGLFYEQFLQAYQAFLAGDYGYGQNVEHHFNQTQHKGACPNRAAEMKFWMRQFASYIDKGADASPYTQHPHSAARSYSLELSQDFSQQIKQFAQTHRTSPYSLLLALFSRALNKKTSYKHVSIGLPVSSRAMCQHDTQIGCFVNMLTYYDIHETKENLGSFLDASHKHIYSLVENLSIPYPQLVSAMREQRWFEHLHFPVSFNYLNPVPDPMTIAHCHFSVKAMTESTARSDLNLTVSDGESLTIHFDYEQAAFSKDDIVMLSEHYLNLISDAIY